MFQPLQRVPKWAYYVSGGLVAGVIAIKVIKGKQAATTDTTTADQAGVTGYTDAQSMPGIVTVPYQPTSAVSDTGTIDPTQQLGTIGDIFAGLVGAIGDIYSQAPIGTGGGSPSAGSTPDPGGVVTVAPPTPTPAAPKANPCVGMASGGSAGACKPAGAICVQQVRCDSNSNGHYCTHKFRFADGHYECYNNYSSGKNAGKCVGPFGCP